MRIIKKEYKVYKFDELPEETKEKVIEKLWDINVSYDWWDFSYDDAKTVGIKIEEFDIERGSYCRGKFIWDAESVADAIKKNHGNKMDTYDAAVNYLKERDELVDTAEKDENGDFVDGYELDNKLDDLEKEFKNNLFECYLTMLRQEYEYQTSREQVVETIKANEYEFTEDGEIN